MEYTKDIILDINCKRGIGIVRFKSLISKLRKGIYNNRLIAITLTLLSTLMVIDIVLINSFLKILNSINY